MAQYDPSKIDVVLNISGEYSSTLDIEGFSLMMKNPSYCYKFYWLEALVILISEGVTETTFDAVIDEMIANAWYSVREFHIHLSGFQNGEVRDGVERVVILLAELSDLPANASKTEIKNAIKTYNKELGNYKKQLTNMVPYRALAGFFSRSTETPDWESKTRMVEYIQRVNNTTVILPYILGTSNQLEKEIFFHPSWIKMIQDNTVSILGWIQFEKIKWLQNNNPEVPGLVYKLAPLDERMRKLVHVRNLWKAVMGTQPIRDVFVEKEIQTGNYDVDHFIPWSFVMNDELWNLMPMDSSLNSSKSNRLPQWDPYFERFASNQYLLYEMIHKYDSFHELYEKCIRDNLHSIWAGQELYIPGNTKAVFFNILEKNMRPVYDSARRQGYEIWNI